MLEFFGWILVILLVVVVAAVLWAVGTYNGFVRQRNMIQESWRQIDVELRRRYDLIPNLVETVRGYAAHERNTLEEVTRLRNAAASMATQSTPDASRADIEGQLSGAVRNLLVSVEAYPELRSNTNFQELQRELTDTEDRIAAGRRFYNANVRNYNTRVESVPSNVIASFAKFEKATYFEVNEQAVRRAPEVDFGSIADRGDPKRINEPSRDPQPSIATGAPDGLPNPQADASFTQPPTYNTQPPQTPTS